MRVSILVNCVALLAISLIPQPEPARRRRHAAWLESRYNAPMHWFWRAAIAVGAGCAFIVCGHVFFLLHQLSTLLADAVYYTFEVFGWLNEMPQMIDGNVYIVRDVIWYSVPITIAVMLYAMLSRFAGPAQVTNETRCRKCDYILRGITEPRCPECGERI